MIRLHIPQSILADIILDCHCAMYNGHAKITYYNLNLMKCLTNISYEMQKCLVEHEGKIIKHFENQTEELCMLAIYSGGLKYIKNPTVEMCMKAIEDDSWNLRYIKNQTIELCLMALKDDDTINFVHDCKLKYFLDC